jgi:hypothetical protein
MTGQGQAFTVPTNVPSPLPHGTPTAVHPSHEREDVVPLPASSKSQSQTFSESPLQVTTSIVFAQQNVGGDGSEPASASLFIRPVEGPPHAATRTTKAKNVRDPMREYTANQAGAL